MAALALLCVLFGLLLLSPLVLPDLYSGQGDLDASRPTRAALHIGVEAIMAIVVGPVCEELIFRGILFRKWRITLGSTRAVWLSSLLFGCLHLNAPYAIVLSLTLTILFTRSGSLLTPIAVHAFCNATLLLPGLLGAEEAPPDESLMNEASRLWLQSAGLVIFGLAWLGRFLSKSWDSLDQALPPTSGTS